MTNLDDAVNADREFSPLSELSSLRVWGMLESAPDGMLMTDGNGIILAVNKQVEAMFGFDRAELLGRAIEVLLPADLHEVHHEHRTRYRAEPSVRAMGEGLELRARRRDGSVFPVAVSLSPLTDDEGLAVVASIRDVTEQAEVERRLVLSEETFRTSFDNAPVGMTIERFDDDGTRSFERVNDSFARMLGRSVESLVGVELGDVSHPDNRTRGVEPTDETTARDRNTWITEMRYLRADGTYVWTLIHTAVIERSDGLRTLTHVVDMTDRRERQEARERLSTMEDRERIARDIHDLVIQRLFGAGMKLQAVIPEMQSDTAVARTHETVDELDAAIRELRSAIFSLHRRDDDRSVTAGISLVIEEHVDRLGFRPTVTLDGPVDSIVAPRANELIATLREALSNVARHAQASAVEVSVGTTASMTTLRVADDGRGVDPGRPRGSGLANMAERVERLGGEFAVLERTTGGCEIVWSIPR